MSKNEIIEALSVASKRKTRTMTRSYVVSTEGDVGTKLAPQALTVLAALFGAMEEDETEHTFSHLDVEDILAEASVSVKQDPMRVFAYYKKALVEAGWITQV